MPFYEKGNVRIHYEEAGAGFPLLVIAGGGLNSTISYLTEKSPFNPVEEFKSEFAMETVRLSPNAEASLYPWKESKDQISQAVCHVRTFLRAHQPVAAAA